MDKPADDLELWRAGARELMPEVVALRRRIHQFPELGLHLPETTRRVREGLAGLDVEIAEGKSTSSLIVTLRGREQGPTVLLRGDMDALPMPEDTGLEFASQNEGRMHACGHDSHTAMLVGAVHLLHRHRDRLAGNVKFFFQTGEEGYAGALHAIEEGMLDAAPAPTAAFAIHISPNIPTGVIASRSGPLMAATDTIHITLTGKGGHASQPHFTRDPIPAACEIVTALQGLVTRRIDAFDPVVLSITKIEAGTTSNVVPESAKLLGTLRSFSEKSRKAAREGIERIAAGIASAHELTLDIDLAPGYPVTVNDDKFVAFAQGVAQDLFGERGFLRMPAPIMGAEDFSYVLQKMPGCMVFLGVAPQDVPHHHAHACHSNRMIMDEEAMANGIAMHAAIAERFLSAPSL
ncbi:MAG: amidohydrolase [Proteobacteria bacterium]|nr:amidohydrolase [Pseudomonadota bacterium]